MDCYEVSWNSWTNKVKDDSYNLKYMPNNICPEIPPLNCKATLQYNDSINIHCLLQIAFKAPPLMTISSVYNLLTCKCIRHTTSKRVKEFLMRDRSYSSLHI